ncbi:MAG: hypothetical protein COU07_01695 [Candidatus Harrisonbacteria bacterium CG10_big_fil_rev_8_21_14_0_10_40_38]|uniref:RNA polymerase subunit sigma-70 n=1 Tax=Candidatus Harrisonbacteria bacterium CG10_big_fil_rev_8_21_14_0_10_40_38 TaxID=1974583 RepID=A0A2H0UT32_9BACT|nr:MAG: hypothetical protein COU07_01695 [Candidatus Harrisonbacteria bacterium CG10_big_fil_rev_8_21_14_0_10_40_38]
MNTEDNQKTDEKNFAELMEKAQNGDTAAFGEIYDAYFTKVFRYIYTRTKNKAEAEDLTHNVFLKVFESASRFKNIGVSPLAYFFTVARNTVINAWRKKKEYLFAEPEIAFENVVSIENLTVEAERKETVEEIKLALENLTDDQQEIITLKFLSELSNKEISDITGKSEEAIRQLQFRGLKALKTQFKNHE